MTQLHISIPPALERWVDSRVAEGRYASADEYLRDLVRRDQDASAHDPRYLRAMIEAGAASGMLDDDPDAVLDMIIAEDPDLRD